MDSSSRAAQKIEALNLLFGRSPIQTEVTAGICEWLDHFYDIYTLYDKELSFFENEKRMLSTFLKKSRLRLEPRGWEDAFSGRDNIFEIYSLDYKQIYRSFSFMRFSTYPLVTLMTHSNFDLYERDLLTVQLLTKPVERSVFEGKVVRFHVPKHKVWEKGQKLHADRHWVMDLGICAPIYEEESSYPIGFFVSHQTEQVHGPPFPLLKE